MPMGTTCTRPAWSAPGSASSPALAAAERHGQVRGQHRRMGFAGVGVHAAGDVAGHHEPGPRRQRRAQDGGNQGGSRSPQPALGARPQHGINDDVGTPPLRGQLGWRSRR